MTMGQTTFALGNYFRPTPKNLLRISEAIQGTFLGISTISMVADAPWWVPLSLNIGVIFSSQIVKFFGSIVHDQEEVAVAEFPSGDTVTLVKETPKDEAPNP